LKEQLASKELNPSSCVFSYLLVIDRAFP